MILPEERMRISPMELAERAAALTAASSPCRTCPNACRAERTAGEFGRCRLGGGARVAGYGPHFGEEPPLVGRFGSGTVFLSACNLACLFCQNARISQDREGTDVTDSELAGIFLRIQEMRCHNLNLVTPTPHTAAIVRALRIARDAGFSLPIVWNCGGYESAEVLRHLDGIVDLYMPDLKYGNDAVARELSGVGDYVARSQAALLEMHRQVGDLMIDDDGVAQRGLLVRHLILPKGLAGTEEVMRFIVEEISRDTYVNVMGQYRPCHRASEIPSLRRRITKEELDDALERARSVGLHRLAPF